MERYGAGVGAGQRGLSRTLLWLLLVGSAVAFVVGVLPDAVHIDEALWPGNPARRQLGQRRRRANGRLVRSLRVLSSEAEHDEWNE
jgi:hypothetical protein